jgi:tRNA nucleotidyltransferase (CCA-adding enzyme)
MMDQETRSDLGSLAHDVRAHFDSIEQDVPDVAYLVGGAVRDTILGRDANDFDFVVTGATRDSMIEHGFEPIDASSFPVFHDSQNEEWALARTEQKTGDGYSNESGGFEEIGERKRDPHKGFDVSTKDVSLEDDLLRRDISINSMAFTVDRRVQRQPDTGDVYTERSDSGIEWALFDPHGGIDDAELGVLRHVSRAFVEDPLRVLRVARYAARFDFGVAGETFDVMRQCASELNLMSRDRIGMEITKAMEQAQEPSRFFETLHTAGALAVVWPELDRASIVPAGPSKYHREGDTFTHSMMVLDRMHELCEDQGIDGTDRVRRLLLAVSHDLGKVQLANEAGGLRSDDPPTRFGGHAELGAEMMRSMGDRLGLRRELSNVMADGARFHMDFHDIPAMFATELVEFLCDDIGFRDDGGVELPMIDGSTVGWHSATPMELLDLAHADHEGRLVPDDSGGVERPEFDRDRFEEIITQTRVVEETVDGYNAMIEGLCGDHSGLECPSGTNEIFVDDDPIHAVLARCDDCRTPGEWIGDEVTQNKIELVQNVVSE